MRGNFIIAQSGGPTSVINASLSGAILEAFKTEDFRKILGMERGIEGFLNDQIIDLRKAGKKNIENIQHSPSSALGTCRYNIKEEDYPLLLKKIKKYNIRNMVLIGGNDTMKTLNKISNLTSEAFYDIQCVGIPKTVDNDIYATDFAPGYGSAARYVAISVMQAGLIAQSIQSAYQYFILQTVGRDTGWLAAAACFAKNNEEDAPHLIYFPEAPVTRQKFLNDVKSCIEKYGWCFIVTGEGVRFRDSTNDQQSTLQDDFGNIEYGSIAGNSIAIQMHKILTENTKYKGEFQVPESLSMCAMDRLSPIDFEVALKSGVLAVNRIKQGKDKIMIAIERTNSNPFKYNFKDVPLQDVAGVSKTLTPEYISTCETNITRGFQEYARPLLGDLPYYHQLEKHPFFFDSGLL